MREGNTGYLPYIDGLRAVAVLAVVAYHLDAAWLPGGFTGVDIFFVISGFVVSASVDRLEPQGPLASLFRFYARRLRRIAPALLACLLATCVASMLFIPPAWLSNSSQRTGLFAFFGLSNWVLAATGNDYFSPTAEFNPYTHTWSLGVEEQFYLLFPLLFLAWGRGGRSRWWSVALFAGSLVASLVRAHLLGHEGAALQAFYLTSSRFWQLAAGVLLYQGMALAGALEARPDGAPLRRPRLHSIGIALAAALVVAGLLTARPGHSPWPDGAWPVLGTLGILGLVYSRQDGWLGRMLSLRPVVAVGRISYSLYLWHWPTFVLFRWTVGLESALARAAALVLAFALALLSYRLVERPLRRARPLVRMRDWRFVGAALVVILASRAAYGHLVRHGNQYSLSVVTRNADDWYPRGEALPPVTGAACEVLLQNRMVGANAAWEYSRVGCAPPAKPGGRIFVAGDSHASGYAEMLQWFVLSTGRPVTLYAAGGCPLFSMQPKTGRDAQCRRYVRETLADIRARSRRGDVLFLPALRLPRLTEQWALFDEQQAHARVFAPRAGAARRRGEATAIARLRPLAQRGVRIVFEAPKPLFGAPAYRCSDWFNRSNPICARGLAMERQFLLDYRAPALRSLRRIASRLRHGGVWDPFPVLCPGATCTAIRAGHPLFFDGDHLSGYGNRLLAPDFTAYVARTAPVGRMAQGGHGTRKAPSSHAAE